MAPGIGTEPKPEGKSGDAAKGASEDFEHMSIHELHAWLKDHKVDSSMAIEKGDLVSLARASAKAG